MPLFVYFFLWFQQKIIDCWQTENHLMGVSQLEVCILSFTKGCLTLNVLQPPQSFAYIQKKKKKKNWGI